MEEYEGSEERGCEEREPTMGGNQRPSPRHSLSIFPRASLSPSFHSHHLPILLPFQPSLGNVVKETQ